jgi:hypothetical protein
MFGIVPIMQRTVCGWGFWPAWMRDYMLANTGPFTGKLNLLNMTFSVLLGSYSQVAPYLL